MPRYVLEKQDGAEQRLLETAIATCNLEYFTAAADLTPFSDKRFHHWLVHLKVKPGIEHQDVEAVLASEYVAVAIFNQLWWRDHTKLRAWIEEGANSLKLGAIGQMLLRTGASSDPMLRWQIQFEELNKRYPCYQHNLASNSTQLALKEW